MIKEMYEKGLWQSAFKGLMHRYCEINLLCNIINDNIDKIGTIIELGCGNGAALLEYRKACGNKPVKIVGFEFQKFDNPELLKELEENNIEIIHADIFGDEVIKKVKELYEAEKENIFGYTDNGHKITELNLMSTFTKSGDILGTHDWLTEVPQNSVFFLNNRDFKIAEQYEGYIIQQQCLQRFWIKE